MNWQQVFDELEAELHGMRAGELQAEVAEMVHAEAATIGLADRLRNQVGRLVNVRLRNGDTRSGELKEANHAWLMLHGGSRRYLIPRGAVAFAWPLGGAAPQLSGVLARLKLGYALRKIAEEALAVTVVTDGGDLWGRIGMVGSDYCDVHTAAEVIAVAWRSILTIEG